MAKTYRKLNFGGTAMKRKLLLSALCILLCSAGCTEKEEAEEYNPIFHRTSVRSFENREVEDEKIEQILKAGFQAPSANNDQPWYFYVVTDREVLQELSEASRWASPAADAPCAIVSAYTEEISAPEYAQIDMAIAMENIWLETDRLGLGGVFLGIAPIEERMKKVEEILDMPDDLHAFCIFAFGYPSSLHEQTDRYQEDRVFHID